jgi:hypothetical protein
MDWKAWIGDLLTLHPPEVVRRMTLPEARAAISALNRERARQSQLTTDLFKAMFSTRV